MCLWGWASRIIDGGTFGVEWNNGNSLEQNF